jgi:methylated-DNA-[protein]-cysteine S-methyltransferase
MSEHISIAAEPAIRHHLFDTAIGPCGVAWSARGLKAVQLPQSNRTATERRLVSKSASIGPETPPAWVAAAIRDIQRYLAGEPVDFASVNVDLDGTDPFHRKVYEALRAVAWGSTTTYGALAREAGSSDWEATREVGQAMAHNPTPIVIPCHRVLAAGNKPGGFSAYGGVLTKERLLALEGVRLDRARPVTAPRLPGL